MTPEVHLKRIAAFVWEQQPALAQLTLSTWSVMAEGAAFDEATAVSEAMATPPPQKA
jgi:hypothetical protein